MDIVVCSQHHKTNNIGIVSCKIHYNVKLVEFELEFGIWAYENHYVERTGIWNLGIWRIVWMSVCLVEIVILCIWVD